MNKRIAIVHDQLREFGGAERVLVALKAIFPDADVFTSVYVPEDLGRHAKLFKDWNIKTSWFDKIPVVRKLYSPLRFLTPYIWESFDFNAYDIVISSSGSCMSHGIVTRPETKHICYLHHPPRYLYGYETAIEWQRYLPVRIYGILINHGLRIWDYLAAQRVDCFIANSLETKKRIAKFYRRDADVIYPPVQTHSDTSEERPSWSVNSEPYYITTSRLARAKHVDLLIKASNKANFHLKIIGSGREAEYLKSIAGSQVTFYDSIADEEFAQLYKHARAFLFASVDEEFGIAPVEALAHGLPVIAYESGGLKEIVIHGVNGFLYPKLTVDSLINSIKMFEQQEKNKLSQMRKESIKSAEKYTFEQFKKNILSHSFFTA